MSLFTGSEYFPGGLGEITFTMNDFLDFELGPSGSVTLQWAKYYDAADEAGISRLWGGIHVPPDDFAGRIIGSQIGIEAYERAHLYFQGVPEPSSVVVGVFGCLALLSVTRRHRRKKEDIVEGRDLARISFNHPF